MKAGIAQGSKLLARLTRGIEAMFLFLGKSFLSLLQDLSQKLLAHLSLSLWKLSYLIPHHLRMVKMLEIKITRTYLKSLVSINQILMMLKLIPQILG